MKYNSTLRVCHLGKYYPPAPGGMESHIRTLAHAQAAHGADVRVICVNHADRHGRELVWSRYGATDTVEETDGPVRVTRMGRSASVAKMDVCPGLPHVLRTLERSPVDVLHLHTPNPTMLLALSVIRPATPLFITHHSDVIRQRVLKYALAPFERFVYRRAARIHATSPAYPDGSKVLQKHEDKVTSLPLGVELSSYLKPSEAALRYAAELKARHEQPLWLAVGRCVYYKNFSVAIQALQHVPGTLMIIGHGPQEIALKQLAEQVGVSRRVIWKSYASQDELVGAYHAATALWFPSNARSEAFGLVQVEAMASGCPVINAHIPGSGVPWVSPHEQTGLTVPLNDYQAFARAALRVLNESGLRRRLGEAGKVRAQEEFDHLTMGRRSLAAYERVLRGASATERSRQQAAPLFRPGMVEEPEPTELAV
ncbi:MAG: glycosyltransferase [Tepidisphaeraceae bacterium]